jgi:hypothetical protein
MDRLQAGPSRNMKATRGRLNCATGVDWLQAGSGRNVYATNRCVDGRWQAGLAEAAELTAAAKAMADATEAAAAPKPATAEAAG